MSAKSIDFLRAYHLSRPALVQQLRETHEVPRRKVIAEFLAARFLIDGDIDVTWASPLEEMQVRLAYGFTWVYPVGQLGQAVAGAPQPPNTITVSKNLADYPPLTPPRSFTLQQHFALRNWLTDVEQGFIVAEGPSQQSQCLPGSKDAEDCVLGDLIRPDKAGLVFEGALIHYGIGIETTAGVAVFDSEVLGFAKLIGGASLIRALIANRSASNAVVSDLLFILKNLATE